MSFYGPAVGDDLNKVYGHLEEVRLLYDKAGHQYFFGDNMVALSRNMAFARDGRFASAFNDNVRNRVDEFKFWRLHTYCWAGRTALALPGDFVECGVFEGFYSAVLLQYLEFATIDKRLFLYDTFTGLSEDYSTEQERSTVGYGLKEPSEWYDEVRGRFAPYPNVEVIRRRAGRPARDLSRGRRFPPSRHERRRCRGRCAQGAVRARVRWRDHPDG